MLVLFLFTSMAPIPCIAAEEVSEEVIIITPDEETAQEEETTLETPEEEPEEDPEEEPEQPDVKPVKLTQPASFQADAVKNDGSNLYFKTYEEHAAAAATTEDPERK